MNRNLKSLPQKLFTYRKRIFFLVSGVAIIILSLFVYSLFHSHKTPPTEERLPEPVEEKNSTKPNQLIDYEVLNQYFCRVVEEIHQETIHVCGDPVLVELKTATERETGTPYLLCQVKSCLSTTRPKKCAHKNYLDCPHPNCAFFGTEQKQFQDYCTDHTCQSYQCRQLVVNYEDGCWTQYCANCLPQQRKF